jgi:hypothetical protein
VALANEYLLKIIDIRQPFITTRRARQSDLIFRQVNRIVMDVNNYSRQYRTWVRGKSPYIILTPNHNKRSRTCDVDDDNDLRRGMGLGNTTILREHIHNPEYFQFLTRNYMTPENVLGERAWHHWRDEFREELEEFAESNIQPSDIDRVLPNTNAPNTEMESANILLELATKILHVEGEEERKAERLKVMKILKLCNNNTSTGAEVKRRLLGNVNIRRISAYVHTDTCIHFPAVCLEAFYLWKFVYELQEPLQ